MASKRGQRRRRAKGRPPMLTGQKLNEALRLKAADDALGLETQRQLALQSLAKAFPDLVVQYESVDQSLVLAELDRMEAEDAEREEGQEKQEA